MDSFAPPPQVGVFPPADRIGGLTYIAAAISSITATGFDVTFESKSGEDSSGSSTFTYQAFGKIIN